jgi:hypothetical protein
VPFGILFGVLLGELRGKLPANLLQICCMSVALASCREPTRRRPAANRLTTRAAKFEGCFRQQRGPVKGAAKGTAKKTAKKTA